MEPIGRNAPCPCGSGKKYKRCCLDRDTAQKKQPQGPVDSLASALDWLLERYPHAITSAYVHFFAACPEAMVLQPEIPAENHGDEVLPCLNEWLIADAYLDMGKTEVPTSELLLGPDGPLLSANERRHIEDLAASTLSMYEVLEVRQGEGLLLRDLLQADEAPFFAHGVQAAKTLVCWDIAGLRILRQADTCTIAEGFCAFERNEARSLVSACVKAFRQESKNHPLAEVREVITFNIIGFWLNCITAPEDESEEPDEQSHEPLVYTTDRYQVSNWEALKEILDDRNDMEWEDDDMWRWYVAVTEQDYRDAARLTYLPPAVLEVEGNSTEDADAVREWLENAAAQHLSHLERIIWQDPSPEEPPSLELPDNCSEPDDLTPEKIQHILDTSKATFYEQWLHTPLPMLGAKSALQASSHPTDRARIRESLKTFEHLEATFAKGTEFKAFDLAFLWERLGLERY